MIYSLDFGDTLPLSFQIGDYNASKYVQVVIRDQYNNVLGIYQLAATGSLGLYLNDSVTMTNTAFATADYTVYDDSGYSMVSASEGGGSDIFILNSLEIGQVLPLYMKLFDYNAAKYVHAFLFDDEGMALAISPVTLTPVGSLGLYGNNLNDVPPETTFITAQYIVYDDSGYTTVSQSEGADSDTFQIDTEPTPFMSATLPTMFDTVLDYLQPMVFENVLKSQVGFQTQETAVETNFQGVWQPFTAQQLRMKPEGQRAWKWFQLHAHPQLILNPDDIVKFQNQNYRVMTKQDYSQYGFVEYHLTNDYTGLGL